MIQPYQIIDKYYAAFPDLRFVLLHHSEQVKEKALAIARRVPHLQPDLNFIAEAALLHDIGIIFCNAPRIHCHGTFEYIRHGYLGADILRNEGLEKHALVCERHTGTGISLDKIIERNLPLPHRDMQPISWEEKIICYADKFYSKTELHTEHSIERIRTSLKHHGDDNVARFDEWHLLFGD